MKKDEELIAAVKELTEAVRSLESSLRTCQRAAQIKDVFGKHAEDLSARIRAPILTAQQASEKLESEGVKADAKTVVRRCKEIGFDHNSINELDLPRLKTAFLEKRRRSGAEKNFGKNS